MEEAELFKQYRETGDIALRNQIAEKYLNIAAVIARKFTGRGIEYDELYQIAALGLIKGIDRFDPTKGVKFITFITPTITGELKNFFRDHARLVHLPRRVLELRSKIFKATEELTSKLGKTPSARELAAHLGVSEEDVLQCIEAGGVVSLDRPMYSDEEDGATFHEMVAAADDGGIEQFENRAVLDAAMQCLNPQERQIIELRYGQGLSQMETGRRLGVTQMYISRVEKKVLTKLRERLKKAFAE